MSDDESMPELETPFELTNKILIDKHKLPIGDVNKQFDEANIEVAMQNRQKALQVYKDNQNEALLLISDSIEMFPRSSLYLNTRAEIFRFHGDVQLAIRDLKLAIDRNGDNVQFKTFKLLSELQFDCQDFSDCIANIQKALRLENDPTLKELLTEAQKRNQELQKRQQEFETQQQVKKEAEKPKKPDTQSQKMNDEIQDNIKNKYGDNPAFQSPLFKNLFNTAQNMNDDKAQELMGNEVLMAAFNDPDFARKIAEVAKDPKAGAKYSNDPVFMKAFGAVLGAFK
ncbi:Heat_shock 70kD protein binding protein [Hexamita inflata]|uniref:Heat shock 70kD protein binding protein n=1 Tax=Hexamita inflata TaxID=28002 RepID=A0AA86RND2_9EUKA|nr:Heat shock 70kD protein binding protein [Hexamita inflata]